MKDYFSNYKEQLDIVMQDEECNAPIPMKESMYPTSFSEMSEMAIIEGIVNITKESIRCFTDYAKCKEHEKTERKRITATLRAIEYQIDAQKEVYL